MAALYPLSSIFLSRNFQINVIFKDVDGAAKFIGTKISTVGEADSRAGIGTVLGNLLIDFARNPSMKQFFSVVLDLAVSEVVRLFCLMVTSNILFAR